MTQPNPYEPPAGPALPAASEQAPPTRVRFLIIGLGMAMSVLLYLDRFAITPVTTQMRTELNLNEEEFGRAVGAFFLVYALMQVPAGWLSDTFGARLMLAIYVLGWSLATMALGLVNGLLAISVVRMILGVMQAGAYPTAASLLKRWIPLTSRGLANSSVAMGGRAGGLAAQFLTPILVVLVGSWFGLVTGQWRIVFAFYGALGLIWVAAFWLLYRDSPQLHPWCNAAERSLIPDAPAAAETRPRFDLPVMAMLASPEVWLICVINFCVNVGWIFLVTWLPTYLTKTHGDYLEKHVGNPAVIAGGLTALTAAGGMLGSVCGGAATDAFVRRWGRKWGRRLPGLCAGFIVLGLYLAAPVLPGVWLFIGAMILISFTIDFGLGATWASYQDIAGRHVATILGFGNMCGNLGAAYFGWYIGSLAKGGHWNTVFLMAGIAMAINATCWLFFDASRLIVREEKAL